MPAVESSSLLSAYEYDDISWTLSITFKATGKAMLYLNVPPELADDFASASSLGSFYNQHIKGHFDSVKEEALTPPAQVAETPKEPEQDFSAEMDRDIAAVEARWADQSRRTAAHFREEVTSLLSSGAINEDRAQEMLHETVAEPLAARPLAAGETALWGSAPVIPTGYRGPDKPNSVTGEMPPATIEETSAKLVENLPEPEILSPEQATSMLAPKNAKVDLLTAELHRLASKRFNVVDAKSQAEAEEFIVRLAQLRRTLFETIDPYRAIAFAAYDQVQKLNKARLAPVDVALEILKRQVGQFLQAEAAKAREAQQRAFVEAQRVADEERRQRTEALRVQVASEQAEAGDHEQAEVSLFDEGIQAPPVPVYVAPVAMPSTSLRGRKNWKAEVVNMEDLILDVAKGIECFRKNKNYGGHASMTVLMPNMTALNQLAKAQEDTMSIPGVLSRNEAVISAAPKGN